MELGPAGPFCQLINHTTLGKLLDVSDFSVSLAIKHSCKKLPWQCCEELNDKTPYSNKMLCSVHHVRAM